MAVRDLPALGHFVGEVDIFTYGRLCYLIDHSQFKSFKDWYEAGWTDDSTCIVTAVSGATQKRVSEYGAVGPIELWGIQQTIDSLRLGIEWKAAP